MVKTSVGAERYAVNPHHVNVHALGVNAVAATFAGHSAIQFRDRLFEQRLSSPLSARSGFLPASLALLAVPAARAHSAISRIKRIFRSHSLPLIEGKRSKYKGIHQATFTLALLPLI